MEDFVIADFVALFHSFLVITILISVCLSFKYKVARLFALVSLLIIIISNAACEGCILTQIEHTQRTDAGLTRGFIVHYFEKVFAIILPAKATILVTYLLSVMVLYLLIGSKFIGYLFKRQNRKEQSLNTD